MDDPAGPPQQQHAHHIYDEEEHWGPTTPESSVLYPKSVNDFEEQYFAPLQRPPRAYARTQASASTGDSGVAHGKRPVQYGYGYGHAGGFKHFPAVVPKVDPRTSMLKRQSVVGGGSARSSVRTRSHLHEVEIAEYEGYGGMQGKFMSG